MTIVRKLTSLRAGMTCRVVAVEGCSRRQICKLEAFGIVPEAEVQVLQTWPVYVLQIGYTELAIDKVLAAYICIK